METDDFALSDGPGYKAALCSKCRQIKPMAEFQRRMSKAYGASKGKVGNVGMLVESSMCRSCQPKPKPLSKLSPKELHNRVEHGDVHAVVVKGELARRHEEARTAARTAAQNAWDMKRMSYWEDIIDPVKVELRRVQQQEKYAKKHDDLHEQALTFFVEYKALLTITIARLKHRQRTDTKREGEPQPKPPHAQWQGYVDATDWHKMRQLWDVMPIGYRTAAKTPELLSLHPTDADPYQAYNKTLRRGPTAAQRLSLKK